MRTKAATTELQLSDVCSSILT